jgi:hypothetical protein
MKVFSHGFLAGIVLLSTNPVYATGETLITAASVKVIYSCVVDQASKKNVVVSYWESLILHAGDGNPIVVGTDYFQGGYKYLQNGTAVIVGNELSSSSDSQHSSIPANKMYQIGTIVDRGAPVDFKRACEANESLSSFTSNNFAYQGVALNGKCLFAPLNLKKEEPGLPKQSMLEVLWDLPVVVLIKTLQVAGGLTRLGR